MAMGRWVAASLMVAALAASSGCRWLPSRNLDQPVRVASTNTTEAGRADLPPLPEMRPIDDEEALRTPEPTPLLDAAAERDAAIQKALVIAAPPSEREEVETIPASPPADLAPEPSPQPVEAPKRDRLIEPATFAPPNHAKPEPVEAPPPEDVDDTLWDYVLSALAESVEPEPAPEPLPPVQVVPPPPQVLPPQAVASLVIADLRICRRVLGFGRTEPLATSHVTPTQAILVYCEVEGLRDEEVNGDFRSRMASSVAIVAEGATEPAWRGDLGIAEDHCNRHRRDYFVSYRLTIPADLAPGHYEVQITQKDLLGGNQATRATGLEIRGR